MKAPNKSLNGSVVDLEVKIESLADGIEEETDGYSKKPEKNRMRSAKPNISEMAKELMDFNGMVRQNSKLGLPSHSLSLSLSLSLRKRENVHWSERKSVGFVHVFGALRRTVTAGC